MRSRDATARATVTWPHRGAAPVGEALVRAVAGLGFPPGAVRAFVHGEANFVKEPRRPHPVARGVQRDRVPISGYWRAGPDEDRRRATGRDRNHAVGAEQG